jgi:flagellar biosynthesis protein FlhF
MNIRRYIAPDMRTAFAKVRDELGPDVVILSTRRVKGQIELTVAADQSAPADSAASALPPAQGSGAGTVRRPVFPTVNADGMPVAARSAIERAPNPKSFEARAAAEPVARAKPAAVARPSAQPIANIETLISADRSVADRSVDDEATPVIAFSGRQSLPADTRESVAALDGEIKALRRLLEMQLASLAWNDLSRRSPAMAELSRELTELGFSRELVKEILSQLPAVEELHGVRQGAMAALAARIPVRGDEWVEKGGVVALVGPAGSGKTTALAALAARWVMRNGTGSAALISAGDTRFGGREALSRLGRLVGLPAFSVGEMRELPALLAKLGERRLILIDTPARSIRSADFEQHLVGLREGGERVQFALALSAASQAAAVREIAIAHQPLGALSCIITHVDECTSLGGLLSTVIERGIPVAYTMEGSRLLDDLRPARAETLLESAIGLARRHGATADEEMLARRMEERINVA